MDLETVPTSINQDLRNLHSLFNLQSMLISFWFSNFIYFCIESPIISDYNFKVLKLMWYTIYIVIHCNLRFITLWCLNLFWS